MHTQRQLLELARKRTGSNWKELAKLLGVVRQAVSQFKHGGPMSTETALTLAKLCGMDAGYVVLCIEHNKLLRRGLAKEAAVYEKIAASLEKNAETLARRSK